MNRWRRTLKAAWRFLGAVVARFNDDQGSVHSGNIAYSLMLAVMPFLIFATALAGFVVGPDGSKQALDALFHVLPEHVARTISPVLTEVVGHRRGGILTLSGLGALWAASNGVEAVRLGLDQAYDVYTWRHIALNRLLSIVVVLGGFAIFTLLAFLIVFAPLVFTLIQHFTPIRIPASANLLRYLLGTGLLYVSLWAMHRLLPSRRMRGLRIWPGVLFSVLIWSMAATAMSVYLAYAPSYTVTYGTLAGVIVTLLFFYMTGLALIFGAEVNGVINADLLARRNRARREEHARQQAQGAASGQAAKDTARR